MPAESFNCPNCGAPLDYDGAAAPTIRCPFCDTSVVVPQEMRPKTTQSVAEDTETARQVITVLSSDLINEAGHRQARRSGGCQAAIVLAIVLFVAIMVIIPNLVAEQASRAANQVISVKSQDILAALTELPQQLNTQTAEALATPTLAPTATPEFMHPTIQFGEKGTGPGLLNDSRYLALDQNGTIYVADYMGGRVQAFDSAGKYLRQFKVGNDKTILYGLAANRQGNVYVAYDRIIAKLDGTSGKTLTKMSNPRGGEFGDLVVDATGNLLATWYEGRWGMITSLEGHSEDLLIYNPQGKATRTVSSFISSQTGDLALDNLLAVDGQGTIYTLSGMEIFKFSPQGKFIDRLSLKDETTSPDAIAIDGQGQVYIGSSHTVYVFSPEGRRLAEFPTGVSVRAMAFDDRGGLWVLSGDQVTRFLPEGK